MASLDLTRALRNPGRLVLSPTSTAPGTTYPYGGTALGYVKQVRLRWGIAYHRVIAEEWNEFTETDRIGEFPILAFVLEQWDDDLTKRVFPLVTTTGSPSGLADIARIDGGAGPAKVAAMEPLLFAPFDPKHKAVYLRRPEPELEAQAQLELALIQDAVFPLVVVATRDASWATTPPWQVDKLEHLVL